MALLAAADLARDGLEEPLGQALHALQVGVGAVGLHGGELGVVGQVHALVAELAADLVHPLHAAHDQALEGKLGRDAQVEVAVERVEVGHEGLGVGAAEDGVHHRRLDLHVAVGLHVAADVGDDLAALAEGFAHLGVHDQVHVALAVAHLAVREAVELLGQGPQGLGEHAQAGGGEGELAAAGADHRARGLHDVAQVHLAEQGPVGLREVVHATEELDLAAHVLEHQEGQLALAALGAHATRQGVDVGRVLAIRQIGVLLGKLRGMGVHVGLDGIGVHARVDKGLPTPAALGLLVVDGGLCHVLSFVRAKSV